MRNLSAVILIVLLASFSSCKFFKGDKEDKAMALLLAQQDSIRVADSLRNAQEALMAIENARLDAERRAEEEKREWELQFKYNIIVGSFITPEYAKDLSEDYKNKGYDTRIIRMEGSRFELVSAEAHASFRKAVERLKEFQDTVNFESWLYINK
jgi:hypothetical protein